jgi:hypothetical protein
MHIIVVPRDALRWFNESKYFTQLTTWIYPINNIAYFSA